MQMYGLIFEFLGTTEVMVILVVALIVFGPRKLPELSRTIGKSIAEFRKATDDFKRTWEREAAIEITQPQLPDASHVIMPPEISSAAQSVDAGQPFELAAPASENGLAGAAARATSSVGFADQDANHAQSNALGLEVVAVAELPGPVAPARKRDWL
jgi:sec-independent protein translocase protein TatA